MTTAKIILSTIDNVKKFVSIVNDYDFEIDLSSGRYKINAKSIMGIFSLDLSQPIQVEAHTDDSADFMDRIKPFIVNN